MLHLGRIVQSLRSLLLPLTLRELHLGSYWNLPVSELPHLPATLQVLSFGRCFNRPVAALQLPASLRTLAFHTHFNQPLHSLLLPAGLHTFAIQCLSFEESAFDRPPAEHPRLPTGLRIFEAPRVLLRSVFAHIDLPLQCVVHATNG